WAAEQDGLEKDQRAEAVKQRMHDERCNQASRALIDDTKAHGQEEDADRRWPLGKVNGGEEGRGERDRRQRLVARGWVGLLECGPGRSLFRKRRHPLGRRGSVQAQGELRTRFGRSLTLPRPSGGIAPAEELCEPALEDSPEKELLG